MSTRAVNVGVLGATGTVGQRFVPPPYLFPLPSLTHGDAGCRFIVLLSAHPFFKIHALGASSRSAGQAYKNAVRWKQTTPIPKDVEDVVVRNCIASEFEGCEIVFSGLDSDVAGDIGESLLEQTLSAVLIVFCRMDG
jgi:aspartate-semialdehyde dehydrogenase